eukprot:6485759-Amphidinium_carterae.2
MSIATALTSTLMGFRMQFTCMPSTCCEKQCKFNCTFICTNMYAVYLECLRCTGSVMPSSGSVMPSYRGQGSCLYILQYSMVKDMFSLGVDHEESL